VFIAALCINFTVFGQSNLIVNPSFEDATNTTCLTGNSGCNTYPNDCYLCKQLNSVFLPGWNLTKGNLDRFKKGGDAGSNFANGVPDGFWALDMNGNTAATINQTVSGLTSGIQYTFGMVITNNMTGASFGCTQDKPIRVNIYKSDGTTIATQDYSTAGLSNTANKWKQVSLTFIPTSSTIKIELLSLFGDASTVATCAYNNSQFTSFYGPGLDQVSLIPGTTVLPVKLRSFTVLQDNDQIVKVSWLTEFELNINNYQIQYSIDGINFSTIHSEPPAKINNSNSYSFHYLQDGSGLVYYRLKIVDNDGSSSFSEIVPINLIRNKSYQIKTIGKHNFIISGLQAGDKLIVNDMLGRQFLTSIAKSSEINLNLLNMATGICQIQILSKNIKKVFSIFNQ